MTSQPMMTSQTDKKSSNQNCNLERFQIFNEFSFELLLVALLSNELFGDQFLLFKIILIVSIYSKSWGHTFAKGWPPLGDVGQRTVLKGALRTKQTALNRGLVEFHKVEILLQTHFHELMTKLTRYLTVPLDRSCLISNSTMFLFLLNTKLPWNLAIPLWQLQGSLVKENTPDTEML